MVNTGDNLRDDFKNIKLDSRTKSLVIEGSVEQGMAAQYSPWDGCVFRC